jgi:hypothetical protein
MNTTWTMPSSRDDVRVLDELFARIGPTIGDLVTTLMRQGKRIAQTGAMFERAFDGKISGGVGHRTELAKRALTDVRLPARLSPRSLRTCGAAGPDELPIVLLVDCGEGVLAVGVRRERGELVNVS